MEKLENFSKKTVYYTVIIILSALSILNVLYTANVITNGENVNITKVPFMTIIAIILIFIMYIFISKIIKHKKIQDNKKIIIPVFLILYIIVNILWINWANIAPTDDSKTVHNIAVAFVENNKEMLNKSTYLEKCPQQIGTALFFSVIYKVFGTTNYRIIQYLNLLANFLTIIALYKIIKKIDKKDKTSDLIYFLLILSFIPLILLTTYVYGDYIGLALMIWSAYLIMNYRTKYQNKFLISSAILMMLSCIIKTNYLVSLIAIIIYLILDIINEHTKILKKITLIILYLIIVLIPYTTIKNVVINDLNLIKTESIPTTGYLYIGMSESDKGAGWYGEAVQPAWDDATKSREIYPKLIKERLIEFAKNPIYCFRFYTRKITSGWIEPFFQSIWYSVTARNQFANWKEISSNNLYIILKQYMKALTMIIYSASIVYIINNKKKLNIDALLLLIMFIGGFLFHFLWEMKSRYVLPYVIIIIPFAALGMNHISKYVENKLKKRKL